MYHEPTIEFNVENDVSIPVVSGSHTSVIKNGGTSNFYVHKTKKKNGGEEKGLK